MNDSGHKRNLVGLCLPYRQLLILLLFYGRQRCYSDNAAVAFAHRAQTVRTQHRFHNLIPGYVGHADVDRDSSNRFIDYEVHTILLRDKPQHVADVDAGAQVEAYRSSDVARIAKRDLTTPGHLPRRVRWRPLHVRRVAYYRRLRRLSRGLDGTRL